MGVLQDQIVIVTGANSGVGASASELLAEAGAHVVLVCRDRSRGEAALARVRSLATGPEPELEIADLASQADVNALADRLNSRLTRIDVLVNNAGVWEERPRPSPDGFETTFAINHLGHFLLTSRLLDLLAAGRGRIVNVSSEAHRRGDLERADLEHIARGTSWKGGIQAYSDSKLANVLFTFESVRRWGDRGITANALHPGVLATRIWNKSWSPLRLMMRLFKPFMKKAVVGGDAVFALVADPSRDTVTGRYFDVLDEADPEAPALDEALAGRLWDRSLEWTGLGNGV